jgi:GntR family transcriptional repressor for pyruvate dehydrogenase complex
MKDNPRQEAVTRLYRAIRDQTIVEEGRLVPERELEKRLSISRPLLRQALAVLEAFGIVEIRDRSGVFVNDVHYRDVSFLDYPVDLLSELLRVRSFIEPEAAFLAAGLRSEGALMKLEEAVFCMRGLLEGEDPEKGNKIERWNTIFHGILIESAQNRFLCRVYQNISDLYQEASLLLRREGRGLLYHEHDLEVQEEHEAIVAAIRDRDGAKSKEEVALHLRRSYERDMKNVGNCSVAQRNSEEKLEER